MSRVFSAGMRWLEHHMRAPEASAPALRIEEWQSPLPSWYGASCRRAGLFAASERLTMPPRFESLSLEDFLRILARRWWLVAFSCVAVAAIAVGYSLTQRQQYTASASLLFRDPGFDQKLFGTSFFVPSIDPVREAATNSTLVSLPTIANRTASALRSGLTPADVAKKVSVKSSGQADVDTVSATDQSPSEAARLANTYAQQYVLFRQQADRNKIVAAQRLVQSKLASQSLAALPKPERNQLESLDGQLRVLAALQTGNAELVQPARVPSSPSLPKTRRNGLLGALVGLFLGLGLAFFFERLDRRIRDPDAIEEAYGWPLVGVVHESSAYGANPTETALPPVEAEAFRLLRARLRYFNVDREMRSLIVTSGGMSDGKTTVALYLAIAECEANARVLLIDADFRRPSVAKRLGLRSALGLSDVLSGSASLAQAVHRVSIALPASFATAATNGAPHPRTLHVLPAGTPPPNPAELTESQRMSVTLKALAKMYDRVIIDSPPMTIVSDIMPLVRKVDGVITVTWVGQETREGARRLRDQLKRLGAPTLGIVANHVPRNAAGYYGYGYHGSAYQPAEPAVPQEPPEPLDGPRNGLEQELGRAVKAVEHAVREAPIRK